MSAAKMLGLDFDGTISLTYETAPGIKGVDEAYAEAIEATMGMVALDQFLLQGGAMHRTPAEIVKSFEPSLEAEEIDALAIQIRDAKLSVLLDQIGSPLPEGGCWPRLSNGFEDLWGSINNAPKDNLIGTAVISAGHAEFIVKCFDICSLPQPEIIVTDDSLVAMGYGDMPAELRAKPNPTVLLVAKSLWLGSHEEINGISNQQIMYVGDDANKDAGLALNCGVGFELLQPHTAEQTWQRVGQWLDLSPQEVAVNAGS